MKKKLESELMHIAQRILELKGKGNILKMHQEVSMLYEKLSVLKFAYENFDTNDDNENSSNLENGTTFLETIEDTLNNHGNTSQEKESEMFSDFDMVKDEEITEQIIRTEIDIKTILPEKTKEIETVIEDPLPKQKYNEIEFEDMMSGFKNMPIFEPVTKQQGTVTQEKKSLNDKLKSGGFNIDLNDKIAFIKHLFDGKNEDYERVMSQLNSFDSFLNAQDFLINIVKPDYNNWDKKEEIEERFLQILESKFN